MWELGSFTTQSLQALSSGLMGYVGPGLGAGVVAVILGLFASVALALFTIFWYPIKRCLRAIKTKLGKES